MCAILSSIEADLSVAAILVALGLVWLVGINVRTYRSFADDRARAVTGQRRLPEYELLNFASMGGSIGAMLAQRRLRHKPLKEPFIIQLRRIVVTKAILLVIIALAILLLAGPTAAAGFACLNPSHHDGDAIRCDGDGRSMRLYGIDAPEMPGACRPGRQCTPGDPYAARDHLQSLTAGRSVTCEQVDTDHYGRRVVRCAADGADLSCAMVAGGHAVERYGRLGCGAVAAAQAPVQVPQTPAVREPARVEPPPKRYYAPADAEVIEAPAAPAKAAFPLAIGFWLLTVNAAAYAAFAIDKQRAIAGTYRKVRRVPENLMLGLAALGGSPAAIFAQAQLRHKTRKQPFARQLLTIFTVQLAAVAMAILYGVKVAT